MKLKLLMAAFALVIGTVQVQAWGGSHYSGLTDLDICDVLGNPDICEDEDGADNGGPSIRP